MGLSESVVLGVAHLPCAGAYSSASPRVHQRPVCRGDWPYCVRVSANSSRSPHPSAHVLHRLDLEVVFRIFIIICPCVAPGDAPNDVQRTTIKFKDTFMYGVCPYCRTRHCDGSCNRPRDAEACRSADTFWSQAFTTYFTT